MCPFFPRSICSGSRLRERASLLASVGSSGQLGGSVKSQTGCSNLGSAISWLCDQGCVS